MRALGPVGRHALRRRVRRNKDPKRFSSAGWEKKFINQLPPELRQLRTCSGHYGTKVLSMTDPPEHTRFRRLVVRSFTPRVLEACARDRKLVEGMLDEAAAASARAWTLIGEFAYPLPAIVIAELLGVPDGRPRPSSWRGRTTIVDSLGTGHPDDACAEARRRGCRSFAAYLSRSSRAPARDPRDDLISAMIAAAGGGRRAQRGRAVATCILLLFAGHETTTNLIGNGMLALLRNPDELAAAARRAGPHAGRGRGAAALRQPGAAQRRASRARTSSSAAADPPRATRCSRASARPTATPRCSPSPTARHRRARRTRTWRSATASHFCLGRAADAPRGAIALRALLERFPNVRLAEELQRALASQHRVPRPRVAGAPHRLSGTEEGIRMAPLVPIDQLEMFATASTTPRASRSPPTGRSTSAARPARSTASSADDTPTEVHSTGGFMLGLAADGDGNVYAIDPRGPVRLAHRPGHGDAASASSAAPPSGRCVPQLGRVRRGRQLLRLRLGRLGRARRAHLRAPRRRRRPRSGRRERQLPERHGVAPADSRTLYVRRELPVGARRATRSARTAPPARASSLVRSRAARCPTAWRSSTDGSLVDLLLSAGHRLPLEREATACRCWPRTRAARARRRRRTSSSPGPTGTRW